MAGHEIALSANLFERCKNARAAGKQKGITFMTHRFVQKWWSMYTPKLSILLKAYEKIYLEYIYIYITIYSNPLVCWEYLMTNETASTASHKHCKCSSTET